MNYDSLEIPGAPTSPLRVLPPDATGRQLLNGVIGNHARWFAARSVADGGETRPVPGGGTLAIGSDEMTLAFPRIAEAATRRYMDDLMVLCRERRPERVSCWARDPRGHGCIGAKLAARGFEWAWQAHWMALDLRAIRTDFPTPPGLRIEVDDRANWDVEDLPYHNGPASSTMGALAAARPRRTWHFGAWLDGKLVAHSALFLSTGQFGVGGIYNVGVIPSARKQGIGRAITVAACVAARKCGANHAVLNSATDIYDRIGFTSIGHGQTWWLAREAILNPPSATEIAFADAVGMGDIAVLNGMKQLPDLDAPLTGGLRPIRLAVRCRKAPSVKWLIARGASLHIMDAWELGWKKEAARLVKDRPDLANVRSGRWNTTPLHMAAEQGDEELAKLLLAARPDLTACDTGVNSTPLGWARYFKRTGIVAMIEGAQ